MKYLSFSLWGDLPIYNIGAIKNAELCKTIYPDWQMIVYYDQTVPTSTIEKLNASNVITVNMTGSKFYGMFWRFFAADLPDCEYAVFRDCDSRLTVREKMAVDEWVASSKPLHVMRDSPYHGIPYGATELGILGGMWGLKGGVINITEMIDQSEFSTRFEYGGDQSFLVKIYAMFRNDRVTHDDYFEQIPFPIKRTPGQFIGSKVDENDNPIGGGYEYAV